MTPEQAQKRAEELQSYTRKLGQHGSFVDGYLAAWHDQQAVIEKLVEALEFYANEKNWKALEWIDRPAMTVNDGSILDGEVCEIYYGGKRAREALKQWKEGGK